MNPKHLKLIVIALFTIGLIARIALMETRGSTDFSEYIKWGRNAYEQGLSASFQGGYFPIQYQSLQLSYAVSESLSLAPDKTIRIVNLAFEIGCLLLLLRILKRYMSPSKVMILFWLNPFMLVMFQQGYVDAQFSFFILAALAMILSDIDGLKKYTLTGIPLGIALLMKPQAIPVFMGLAILAGLFVSGRKWSAVGKIACLVVMPIILYGAYSLYFGLTMDIYKGHETLPRISETLQTRVGISPRVADISAGSAFLTAQYAYIAKNKSAINAQMANPWFLVATSINQEKLPIYRVSDNTTFLGIRYRTMSLILLFAATIAILVRIYRKETSLDMKMVLAASVMPILLPYLGTNAHENHFFLGFIVMIIMAAILENKRILWAAYALACLNAINLVSYYVLPYYLQTERDQLGILPTAMGATVVFGIFLFQAFKRRTYTGVA